MFLQATHSSVEEETEWARELHNENVYFLHGTSLSRGTCIIIPSIFNIEIIEKKSSITGMKPPLKIYMLQPKIKSKNNFLFWSHSGCSVRIYGRIYHSRWGFQYMSKSFT